MRSLLLTDDHQASLLRSVLLFNSKNVSKSRDNMVRMVLLSYVLNVSGYENCSTDYIIQSFNRNFGYYLDKNEVEGHLKKLVNMGLITIQHNGLILPCRSEEVFFDNLSNATYRLIESIIARLASVVRVEKIYIEQIKDNITNALIAYYNLFGHEILGTKRKDTQKSKLVDVLSFVRKGLDELTGEALIRAIADVISNPDEEDRKTMEMWARSYAITQVINLDPKLREYKASMFKDKEFIIDTDVLLNCLARNARFSSVYKSMISALRSCNCKLYIPNQVICEVCDHAEAALKRSKFMGENTMRELTDELLEGDNGNVFIEDYVKLVRGNQEYNDLTFVEYMSNIYNPEYPALLHDSIRDIFGNNVFDNQIDTSKIDSVLLEQITNKLIELIVKTTKGAFREDEENENICRADATYYLYISDANKKNDVRLSSTAKKVYLLTRSTRVIKVALDMGIYEENIVCNPAELIPILNEIGIMTQGHVDYINLFANPFLAYAANKVWDDIEPIINKHKVTIKHADLNKLRLDANVQLHKMLTASTMEEREEYANEYADKDYELAIFFRDILNENKSLKIERGEMAERMKELEDKNQNNLKRIKALEKVAPKVKTAKINNRKKN